MVLANKMDLTDIMTASECSAVLALEKIKDRNWFIWYKYVILARVMV